MVTGKYSSARKAAANETPTLPGAMSDSPNDENGLSLIR
jgi:hypothetical protein